MHLLFASSLFDNPWVLLVIVVVSALSNWLMKRRQGNEADSRPDRDEPLPAPGDPEIPQRPPDLQDVLRQLLGGEPPLQAPPPPLPPVMRSARPAQIEAEAASLPPEPRWIEEPQVTPDRSRPLASPIALPPPLHPTMGRASAMSMEVSGRHPKPAPHLAPRDVPAGHAATVVHISRPRSPEGARVVALVRQARTVRQAYLASIVFGPPKALEG